MTVGAPVAESCTLCSLELSEHPIREEEYAFCCPGCHAVYKILSAQGSLNKFEEHPVFRQAVESGLISNPSLLEELRQKQPSFEKDELQKLHLEIEEMWCPSCAEIIRLVLLQQKGVRLCVIDYATDLASIEFAPRYIGKEQILKLIQSLGYQAHTLDQASHRAVSKNLWFRFSIAAFCTVNIMMFSYPIYASYFRHDAGLSELFAWLSFGASLPVVSYSMSGIWKRFWNSLRFGLLGMESLVVIGVSTAFSLSVYRLFCGEVHVYFDSLSVIITLVLLGKIIESKAKFSAKETVYRLQRSLPRKGRKVGENGQASFVLLKEIEKGDVLEAYTGEQIVLDGTVIHGRGTCDESCLTGESIPVSKTEKSEVLAGTIVRSGQIRYQVNRNSHDSALQRILHLVERDIGQKTNYERAIDPVVRYFVPVLLLLAFSTGSFLFLSGIATTEEAITRTLSILLISCPCAIGIAAPLAESLLMNRLAEQGGIVRNRGVLRLLGEEDVHAFDKTGTLTEGKFTVISGIEQLGQEEQAVLKTLSQQSIHPISNAINRSLSSKTVELEYIEEIAGKGLRGRYQNEWFLLGSKKLLQENNLLIPQYHHEGMKSYVYFAKGDNILSIIVLGDQIRCGVPSLLHSLSSKKTVLLSGDSNAVVQHVAQVCDIKEAHAECSPLQKHQYIQKCQKEGKILCMYGDGINDAPALTAADVSMSVVSASDISIQVSDVLLTSDDLSIIPKIHSLARLGRRIIKQNIFWAFFYNAIGIVLAVSGALSPLFAAVAMICSSLFVVANAWRLKLTK
ncbi:MAG: ATPase P [Waddliaceae bacterium]|nr:ATPase P [Waddliaceae bacterium]